MTDSMDTFWFHICGNREVWTPIGRSCVICNLTQEEADSAWRKGTLWENK